MLGAKERALLLALSETEYCTSGTLAKALGVSSKTAQGMVKDLREKLQKNGADILARTRHGYLLQVNDRALFETLSSGENAAAHFIPSGSEERIHYLLVLLLGQVDYVKLDDVSEELYVSKYTISGDLHQVEEELAKYHLSILRRPNYGIRITGREIDIRNCTAHVLANYNNMMPDGGAGYRNMAQRISQCLMRAMHKHALHFSEINFRNLVNTIFATIHRALQHAFIPLLEEDSAPDINENVYAAAHYLAELLEAQFDIRLPEPEVLFLALNIAGKCNYSSADREDENVVIAPEIMALVDDMLESIYESFKLDYGTRAAWNWHARPLPTSDFCIRGNGTMKEFEYTVQDQLGIHARPAGQIAKLAKAHPDCEISFAKISGSKTANAARVMALMSLGAKPGDVLHITVEGANEESVTTAMQELLNSEKL